MPERRVYIAVSPQEAGLRLEQFVRERAPQLSRGAVRRLLDGSSTVRVDGRRGVKGQRLRAGQRIELEVEGLDPAPIPRPDLPLDVVGLTDELVALNKPEGIPTHPLTPGEPDSLAGRLVAHFPECLATGPRREAGLVQRLDASTSGLVLASRSAASYSELRQAFSAGRVTKTYLALVSGRLKHDGVITGDVSAVPGDRRRVEIVPPSADHQTCASLPSTTYQPLLMIATMTVLRLTCSSGRRHQVRVHLASIGHPLVDDALYGGPQVLGTGQAFLHASSLQYGELSFQAPLSLPRREVLLKLARGEGLDGSTLERRLEGAWPG